MGLWHRPTAEVAAPPSYLDPDLVARLRQEGDLTGVLHANVTEVADALRITEGQAAALLQHIAGATVSPAAEAKRMRKVRRDMIAVLAAAFVLVAGAITAGAIYTTNNNRPIRQVMAPSEPGFDLFMGGNKRGYAVTADRLLPEMMNLVRQRDLGSQPTVPDKEDAGIIALARAGKWESPEFDRVTVRITKQIPDTHNEYGDGRMSLVDAQGRPVDPKSAPSWKVSVPDYTGNDPEAIALVRAEQARRLKELISKISDGKVDPRVSPADIEP